MRKRKLVSVFGLCSIFCFYMLSVVSGVAGVPRVPFHSVVFLGAMIWISTHMIIGMLFFKCIGQRLPFVTQISSVSSVGLFFASLLGQRYLHDKLALVCVLMALSWLCGCQAFFSLRRASRLNVTQDHLTKRESRFWPAIVMTAFLSSSARLVGFFGFIVLG